MFSHTYIEDWQHVTDFEFLLTHTKSTFLTENVLMIKLYSLAQMLCIAFAQVAIASCTDEPTWAYECLKKFEIGNGLKMIDCVDIFEIHKVILSVSYALPPL